MNVSSSLRRVHRKKAQGPRTGILPSVQFLCTFRRSIIWNTNHAFTGCFQLVCQVEWIVRSRILLFVKSNLTFPIFSEIYNYKVSTDWTRCIMFSKLYLRTQIQMIFSTFSKRGGGHFLSKKICRVFVCVFWGIFGKNWPDNLQNRAGPRIKKNHVYFAF